MVKLYLLSDDAKHATGRRLAVEFKQQSLGDIPSLGDDTLTIFIPDDSSLLLCDNDFKKIRNFTVSEGPELVLNSSGEKLQEFGITS